MDSFEMILNAVFILWILNTVFPIALGPVYLHSAVSVLGLPFPSSLGPRDPWEAVAGAA